MTHLIICAILLTLWPTNNLAQASIQPSLQTDVPLERAIRESHIIFSGAVERLNASNVGLLSPRADTAVVRVQENLYAPASILLPAGTRVTVLLANQGNIKSGDEAVFFTDGWLYGENLAVREVAPRISLVELKRTQTDTNRLRAQIEDIHQKMADEKLQARISSAPLIITGEVIETRPLVPAAAITGATTGIAQPPLDRDATPRSEHDPDWWEARVQIKSVEKGKSADPVVSIIFPNSGDELWLLAPKFHRGDKGIWLLHVSDAKDLPPNYYVALDPLDFHPATQLDHIRRLIH
jgi:hypothetical protein